MEGRIEERRKEKSCGKERGEKGGDKTIHELQHGNSIMRLLCIRNTYPVYTRLMCIVLSHFIFHFPLILYLIVMTSPWPAWMLQEQLTPGG